MHASAHVVSRPRRARAFGRPDRSRPAWNAWRAPLLRTVVVVLGMVVSQLAGLGHLALVSHARCEHGALIHGESAETRAPLHASEMGTAEAVGAKPVAAQQGEGPEATHEHCAAAAVHPAILEAFASCAESVLLEGSLLAVDPRCDSSTRPVAILSFAPKSSPPV